MLGFLLGKSMYRVRQIPLPAFKKKLRNIFSNFFFYNFIQITASAGRAIAYTIGSIFKHIIDYVQLYFINDFTNIVF